VVRGPRLVKINFGILEMNGRPLPETDLSVSLVESKYVPWVLLAGPVRKPGWRASAIDFAKYDVEGAEYRTDIGEHVSASQEFHCRQVWE
jgi:hypothetical protein